MGYDTTAWTTAGNTLTIGGTTLYTDFGIGAIEGSQEWLANTHYALPYNGVQAAASGNEDDMTLFLHSTISITLLVELASIIVSASPCPIRITFDFI